MDATLIVMRNTLIQFTALFGVLVLACATLTLLSRWTGNSFRQFRFPSLGMYVFGVVGVPLHELSHALFCKIFLHEVKNVTWFDPKARHGAHGSVTHTYHPWNIYHRMGHFFIGLAPVLLAPVFLALLFYLLVPSGRTLFSWNPIAISEIGPFLVSFFRIISSTATLSSLSFWLFLYLAIAISSQMELSREDIIQAIRGVPPLMLVLFLINVAAWLVSATWHDLVLNWSSKFVALTSCFYAFAIILAAFNLALCTAVLSFINALLGRRVINPFLNQD